MGNFLRKKYALPSTYLKRTQRISHTMRRKRSPCTHMERMVHNDTPKGNQGFGQLTGGSSLKHNTMGEGGGDSTRGHDQENFPQETATSRHSGHAPRRIFHRRPKPASILDTLHGDWRADSFTRKSQRHHQFFLGSTHILGAISSFGDEYRSDFLQKRAIDFLGSADGVHGLVMQNLRFQELHERTVC